MIERIAYLFENNERSARQLLMELGFSLTDLSEWKRGKSKPNVDKLIKIAPQNATHDTKKPDDETPETP